MDQLICTNFKIMLFNVLSVYMYIFIYKDVYVCKQLNMLFIDYFATVLSRIHFSLTHLLF